MLIDTTIYEEFVKEFKEKFKSFCKRSPLILSYKLTPDYCYVIILNTQETKKFELDYSKTVFENISKIKEYLLNKKYPYFLQKKPGKSIKWRIEKINVKKGDLIVRNMETKETFNYKLKMSLVVFLKKLMDKSISKYEAFNLFKEKAKLIRKVQ